MKESSGHEACKPCGAFKFPTRLTAPLRVRTDKQRGPDFSRR